MPDLYLHNRKLESIFELLGVHENDITYSIGWALSQSPAFLKAFLHRLHLHGDVPETTAVKLQEHQREKGITDIELAAGNDLHVIIEAKRGWTLPTEGQLELYAERLEQTDAKQRILVVLAECSPEHAGLFLPKTAGGFQVAYLSWKEVGRLATGRNGTHAEKRLLGELRTYLGGLVQMQDQKSNMAYVLSLGAGIPEGGWCSITWRAIVNEKARYFYPVGKRWPPPPNYLAFRYDGKLQTIHHVESWKVVTDMHREIPEIRDEEWDPTYLFRLGPAIRPACEVRNGPRVLRANRVNVMLDLLLTSKTISEALDLTEKRLAGGID